jgi:HlyD family secretion protein
MQRLFPTNLRAVNKVNALLAVAVLIVVGLIIWSTTGGDTSATQADQTVSVDRGEVTSSVTASGNLEAAKTVDVSFDGNGGVVERIYVKAGDHVERGDLLARIDQTAARQSLATARATLRSAQAQRETATQGRTSQERHRDAQSIAVSRESVRSAEVALAAARDTYDLDSRIQDGNVQAAEAGVTSAQQEQAAAQAAYTSDPSDANAQALASANSAVATAQSALRSARSTRSSVLLQDQQNVDSRRTALASARAGLSSTKAGVAVSAQPPRAGAVDAADAQVASAEVTVAQAQTTLSKTVLRAPAAGTVATVNGTVGQSSSAAAASTSSSTTTSTGSDTSSGSTSGFVTLTDVKALQVTAMVAEADINDVKVGQAATVELSASGKTLQGTVSGIDTVQTVTNNVVEYGVTVQVTGDTQGARLGQSSDITITTGSKTGVLRAPSSALTTIGGRTTATVRDASGKTRSVTVQTGLEGDSETEILSGLADGDVLVVPQQAGAPSGFTFPGGAPGGLGGIGAP